MRRLKIHTQYEGNILRKCSGKSFETGPVVLCRRCHQKCNYKLDGEKINVFELYKHLFCARVGVHIIESFTIVLLETKIDRSY